MDNEHEFQYFNPWVFFRYLLFLGFCSCLVVLFLILTFQSLYNEFFSPPPSSPYSCALVFASSYCLKLFTSKQICPEFVQVGYTERALSAICVENGIH